MKIYDFSNIGYEGQFVTVEISLSKTSPGTDIVGVSKDITKQSVKRVRAAMEISDFEYPTKRVLVNLSPANLMKDKCVFDLSIAIAILSKTKQLKVNNIPKDLKVLVMGELMIEDGSIREVSGVLSALQNAKNNGFNAAIVPELNSYEVSFIKDFDVVCVSSLIEAVSELELYVNTNSFTKKDYVLNQIEKNYDELDFEEINDSNNLAFAYQVAISGRHNVLLYGPPGKGKSLSVKCALSLMPKLDIESRIESTRVYSATSAVNNYDITYPPFRSPHHSATPQGLIGGGRQLSPGEISLAHKGVLFLDEIAEFSPKTIQSLREPLQEKKINLSHADYKVWFPADFLLIAATNPCPCGNYGSTTSCLCKASEVERYWKKIGGAVLDRIPIRLRVDNIMVGANEKGQSSNDLKTGILEAINIQEKRFQNSDTYRNSDMKKTEVEEFCKLDFESQKKFEEEVDLNGLSLRAEIQILTMARTIADIRSSQNIELEDIEKALGFRIVKDAMFASLLP